MAALAPALSHALQAGVPEGWIEICTELGPKLVAGDEVAPKKPSPASPADHLLKHCPYCSLHITDLGLPPVSVDIALLDALASPVPALFLSAPRTPHAWVTAQPRAPPLFS